MPAQSLVPKLARAPALVGTGEPVDVSLEPGPKWSQIATIGRTGAPRIKAFGGGEATWHGFQSRMYPIYHICESPIRALSRKATR